MDAGLNSVAASLYGLRRSLEGLRREAQTVARAVTEGSTADLPGTSVRMAEEQRTAEANAAAMRRQNDALGSVIDVRV